MTCEYCDGTGDVIRADGEWLGSCDCASPSPSRDETLRMVVNLLDSALEYLPNIPIATNEIVEARALVEALRSSPVSLDSRLVDEARELVEAETAYRTSHDLRGGDHIETGRAWDRMRRAGLKVRAALSMIGEG